MMIRKLLFYLFILGLVAYLILIKIQEGVEFGFVYGVMRAAITCYPKNIYELKNCNIYGSKKCAVFSSFILILCLT